MEHLMVQANGAAFHVARIAGGKPGNDPARYRDRAPRRRRASVLGGQQQHSRFRDCPAWHSALADAGVTVEQNWAALSTRK